MPADDKNLLAYGDNLDVLRRYVRDESVDLVYLDPPFNSNADYNILYGQQDGTRAAAQIKAFKDTWRWDQAAVRAYEDVVERGGEVARALKAFRTLLGTSNLMAYLAMMTPRLVELRRALRSTGSLYLHCDPTASSHLKLLLDAVFGPENFRNELVWKRTSSHNDAKKWADIGDRILFYVRSDAAVWNPQFMRHNAKYVESHYGRTDAAGRRYRLDNVVRSASMGPRPNLVYEFKGFTPKWGWRVVMEKLTALDAEGRIAWSKSGTPYLVRYLDEQAGAAMPSIWDDIPPVNSQAKERLGYPTQKPLALLERIISASSNPGDLVLDPFCGCGTAVAAAQRMDRRWIGIDITHHATALIKNRLIEEHGPSVAETIRVIGEPTTTEDAAVLADDDPYQFQAWALGLVGARPSNGVKKGGDAGIDGNLYFHESEGGTTRRIVFSVKGGGLAPTYLRDLRGVIEREEAEIGVLISMRPPSQKMRAEAADAGSYVFKGKRYPRLQLRTVAELLDGHGVEYPATTETVFRPTIWPPEAIPTVPRKPRTRRPRVAAAQATWTTPDREPQAASEAAARLREDYARRADDSQPDERKVAEKTQTDSKPLVE